MTDTVKSLHRQQKMAEQRLSQSLNLDDEEESASSVLQDQELSPDLQDKLNANALRKCGFCFVHAKDDQFALVARRNPHIRVGVSRFSPTSITMTVEPAAPPDAMSRLLEVPAADLLVPHGVLEVRLDISEQLPQGRVLNIDSTTKPNVKFGDENGAEIDVKDVAEGREHWVAFLFDYDVADRENVDCNLCF